ncbi:MAG TPA: AAA family ATPase [Ignavibacteriaceae bacterium]|nr:AAA family ATPase [Ignavibacteriaceae bacterium]
MNSPGKYSKTQNAGQAQRVIELSSLRTTDEKPAAQIRDKLKIAAFSSGKGGTGKSFLSLNTALELSKNKKLLFIDLDLNLSNIHLMLNTVPRKTIGDYFERKRSLYDLISREENPHFIFGESGSLTHPNLTENRIEDFFKDLHELDSEYDFIFLDIGSGIGDNVINFLYNSDINIIVSTPEPTSIMDAYVVLKILKANSYMGRKTIVINKCSSLEEGKNAFANLNSASGNFLKERLNLLGLVQYNQEIIQTIIEQIPFMKKYSSSNGTLHSKSISQIRNLAAGLIEIQQMANIHQR